MAEPPKFTPVYMTFETRMEPIVSYEPFDLETEQQVAAAMDRAIGRALTAIPERLLFGRAVTGVTVVDGTVLSPSPPRLPPGDSHADPEPL